AKQAWHAFLPIRDEIKEVIKRVQDECNQRKWDIDRVMIVGGFGQYHLVQQTIFECFPDIHQENNSFFVPMDESSYTISKGAYYIVSGMVQIAKPIRDTLGIVCNRLVDGEIRRIDVTIVDANQMQAGRQILQYAMNR